MSPSIAAKSAIVVVGVIVTALLVAGCGAFQKPPPIGSKQWQLSRVGNDPVRGPEVRKAIEDEADLDVDDSSISDRKPVAGSTIDAADLTKGLELFTWIEAVEQFKNTNVEKVYQLRIRNALTGLSKACDSGDEYYSTRVQTEAAAIVGYPLAENIKCANGRILTS